MTVLDLVIQTLSGTSFDLRVSPYETVMSVKARIQTHEGIPISQQHLIFRNCELKNDYCLNDYAIQSGATLRLVLAMRGGPISTRRINLEEEAASSSVYESSVADFADLVDGDYVVERLSDGDVSASASNNQPNSKLALLVVRDGDQVSVFRLVEHGDSTPTPRSGSASSKSQDERDESPLRRTVTATEFSHSDARKTRDTSPSEFEDPFEGQNLRRAAMARSGSIPPSASRPACHLCPRDADCDASQARTQNTIGKHGSRMPSSFRNATDELKRFKENEDLRSTVRALRAKMANLRVSRERLRTQTSDPEPPKTDFGKSGSTVALASNRLSSQMSAVAKASGELPQIKGRPTPLRNLEKNNGNDREKAAQEVNRVLSSLKLLEPLGVTRLRSSSVAPLSATSAHAESPSAVEHVPTMTVGSHLPPIESARVTDDATATGNAKLPAAPLNASIKSTISASFNLFSALQQNTPLAKPAPAAVHSKQRCALCGRKTGLANSYVCRYVFC